MPFSRCGLLQFFLLVLKFLLCTVLRQIHLIPVPYLVFSNSLCSLDILGEILKVIFSMRVIKDQNKSGLVLDCFLNFGFFSRGFWL